MEVLYLSSLCSLKEYERMFCKYGSTSSHASQKFNRMLVSGLIRNGCNVDALTQRILPASEKRDLVRPEETENGIHYNYLPGATGKIGRRLSTIWHGFWEICKWHRHHPNGIVVCDTILGELSIAVWLASRIHALKTTAIVTDVPNIQAGENRTGLRAIPRKIKNALIASYGSYIFLTEQMNALLNPAGKPYVIIEGIVDEGVLAEPNVLEQKHPEKVCMMAGLLENIFGVDTLLEAFLRVDCPDARLVFYGKGSSVPEIMEAGKVDCRIQYLGELTNWEIVREEKKATLLINPRPPVGTWTAYSFPSKNMEYIASGTPMLAYTLPCIPEGYLPYSFYIGTEEQSDGLYQALKRALETDREKLHEFGPTAQQWIVANKNAEKQTKKAVEMMELLVKEEQ